MRALEPTEIGTLMLEGFRISYEVFGDPGAPPVLLLPTWQVVHSRHWKMQVPFLARSFRVITFDAPGNGGGERTEDEAAFEHARITEQAIGLLDYLGVEQADVIGFSMGTFYAILMAALYPERVRRLVLIGTGVDPDGWIKPQPGRFPGEDISIEERQRLHRQWAETFFTNFFPEAHSTKAFDDGVSWAMETTRDILRTTVAARGREPSISATEAVERVRCPVLMIHGTEDRNVSIEVARKLAARRPNWELVELEGSAHGPHLRDPVRVNLLIEEFLSPPRPRQRRWRRSMTRSAPRALFISSPIGLGHVQRDLAIARELRHRVPDLQIEWLAQHPVTRVLEEAGETIHPRSALLSSESAHWERSAGPHELHCFQAWREMDEILLANFMVFLDAVRETPYDLWIGDEAWEVDYYLHENPELKTAPFVFLTDFIGWIPMDRSKNSREAFLTADYNAEMIEQVERFPRVRDRALYVGGYEDIIPEPFGPGLPAIAAWTREHFDAVGYITPFDPAAYTDIRALRSRLGYDPDRPLVMCAVGGTAVGRPLLERTIEAWPLIHQERPEAQCVVVAGPRIAPESLPSHDGLEVRPYVHNLYEHLAAADLAVVQGGLTTTMELALNRRPFIYFPLRNHCEQVYHVAHRLDCYRAGRRLDYAATTTEHLAEVALETLGSDTGHYRPYAPGAAARAAERIAELL